MKILFVAQNLNIGGVQTSLKNTCNMLLKEYADIDIELFTFSDGAISELLDKRIKVKKGKKLLNLLLTPINDIKTSKRLFDLFLRYLLILCAKIIGVKNLYSFLFLFERTKDEYDVAISFFNDVPGGYSNKGTNWYVDKFVKAKKKAAWIHTDPEKAGFNEYDCEKTYRNFDIIACVSNATKHKFDEFLPEYKTKTCVVYNIFDEAEIKKKATCDIPFDKNGIINLITVGRIDNATKRLDRIAEICKSLKAKGITAFKWRIVGDGPDFEKNMQLVEDFNIGDVVEFVGAKINPYPYIKNSDLFVLTSDYEGYPMVIGESLLLGVPVITTSFAAASEMVTPGVNGYITGMNTEELLECVGKLLLNPCELGRLKGSPNETPSTEVWQKQMLQIL